MKKQKQLSDITVLSECEKIGFPLKGENRFLLDDEKISMLAYVGEEAKHDDMKPEGEEASGYARYMPRLHKSEYMGVRVPLLYVFDYLNALKHLGVTYVEIMARDDSPLLLKGAFNVSAAEGLTFKKSLEYAIAPNCHYQTGSIFYMDEEKKDASVKEVAP